MDIHHFDDLLTAARQQPQPQRLLLVFAGASLPAGASAAQRAAWEAGHAGELAPLMCVDKDPQALSGFDALVQETTAMGLDWALVLAAALDGSGGRPPEAAAVDAALQHLVEAVKAGRLEALIPFDRHGDAVLLG